MSHLHGLPNIPGSKDPYLSEIDADKILIVPEAQRDLDAKRAARIADNWRPELLTALVVHDNGDGTYNCLDGQHRHAGAGIAGIKTLPCVVLTGLTLEQQATLFLLLQKERRSVSPYSTYKVSLTAEADWALEVQAVVEAAGLTVAGNPGKYTIGAVKVLEKTYRLGGKDLLEKTVKTVKDAYCPTYGRDAWQSDILYGVAKFYHKNPSAEVSRTAQSLQFNAPRVWLGFLTAMSGGSGGSEGRASHMATLLARRYNVKLRTVSKRVSE